MKFDPAHSPVEKDPSLVTKLIHMLEEELGNETTVIGILEIGSFAKAEAIPQSDIDTRIYLFSPKYVFKQTTINRFDTSQKKHLDEHFEKFKKTTSLPIQEYDWWRDNVPLAEKIHHNIGLNIEFGFVDKRYFTYEIENIASIITSEHAFLLQSNILYDPQKIFVQKRKALEGKYFNHLGTFYQNRYLDALPFEIYSHIQKEENDDFKLRKSMQIQWVKWAVRCLRDAVATKTYLHTGYFTYKKNDVLAFYARYFPKEFDFIHQIYIWKTDPKTRKEMVTNFTQNREQYFRLFASLMPQLELVVKKVHNLTLS